MDTSTLASDMLAARTEASAACVDEQRRELQQRIEALQSAGALPTAPAGDPTASLAQWTNWSNG